MWRSPRFSILLLLGTLLASSVQGQTITEFPIPTHDARPTSIAAGPDGNLWFTETYGSKIGRISTTGVIAEFTVPGQWLEEIAAGSDGNLWFTQAVGIGRITTAGVITVFQAAYNPAGIAAGPDGNLWFVEMFGSTIGRITTNGVITTFAIPTPERGLYGIAAGPDGNLWFTTGYNPFEPVVGKIGRITPSGVITLFTAPTANGGFAYIAAGPDGNLWFTEPWDNRIGRITTTGVITEFTVPTINSFPLGIAAGSDGAVWFTEGEGNKIGRITAAGAVTEFPVPTPNSSLNGIAAGPDGNLWFIEFGGNKIGRITAQGGPAMRILPVVMSSPGVPPSLFKTELQLVNPTGLPASGTMVFHPQGTPGSSSDPSIPYTLAPYETRDYEDLLPAFGLSGVGTLDLIPSSAGSAPLSVTRVFNDAQEAGTTGCYEEQVRPEDALEAGSVGVLIAPGNPSRFRFNIGVRSLASGASITVTVRAQNGVVIQTVSKTYSPTFFEQAAAADFLGSSLPPNASLFFSVTSGSVIIYGATADNISHGPSLQLAKKVF